MQISHIWYTKGGQHSKKDTKIGQRPLCTSNPQICRASDCSQKRMRRTLTGCAVKKVAFLAEKFIYMLIRRLFVPDVVVGVGWGSGRSGRSGQAQLGNRAGRGGRIVGGGIIIIFLQLVINRFTWFTLTPALKKIVTFLVKKKKKKKKKKKRKCAQKWVQLC